MNNHSTEPQNKPGEFPFRLTHSATESPFLTWLRNHSNYMAARGFLDYLRIAAVLIRGILVNSLVTLPVLLGIALALGLLYGTLLENWTDQIVPSEEKNKAFEDVRYYKRLTYAQKLLVGAESPNSWSEEQKKLEESEQRLQIEKEKMERRRQTAPIRFFLTNLNVKKAPFQHEDFIDLGSMAAKLTLSTRPIDRWVQEHLPEETRTALAALGANPAQASPESKRKFREALYEYFNLLLHNPYLYDEARFQGVTLRPGTKKLIAVQPGSRNLAIGGFTDLPSLARKLKDPAGRSIDRWLAEQLSPETRKLLTEYQGASSDSAALRSALAQFFEGLIRGPALNHEDRFALSHEDRFAEVKFRPKTSELLKETLTTDTRIRLNRLLIEDAYPVELWWSIGGVDLVCLNHLLLEDAYPTELRKQYGGWVMCMQDHLGVAPPFVLTPVVLVLVALWILIFPVMSILAKIFGHQKSLQTGSDSSVKSRDGYERTFGAALLVVLAVASFEVLPLVVHFYHQFRLTQLGGDLPWKQYIAAAGTVYAVLSSAQKLTSSLSGLGQKLVMAGIGLIGLLAPFMVIIAATDFLVYSDFTGNVENALKLLLPLSATPAIYTLVIAIALGYGLFTGTFSAREARRLVGLAVVMILFHLALIVLIGAIYVSVYHIQDYLPAILVSSNPSDGGIEFNPNYGDLSVYFVLVAALEIALFCWLAVDVNLTSVHGLYRDRLASAYLLRLNPRNKVDIEDDVPLSDLCRHEAGSVAPYHLINVALNLQGSRDPRLRNRQSDFFIFSKKFIGGARTGYCRSVTMGQVFPQIDLASAMAISAAAASPNMGRGTNPWLVPFLTLLNIRLGVWVPHPGRLADTVHLSPLRIKRVARRKNHAGGFTFEEVFRAELDSITTRWRQLGPPGTRRQLAPNSTAPTPAHGLAGIGFSGGGIRSATINLGIAQVLEDAGIFAHFDYMSTVSGGGYLGSSISARMRFKTSPIATVSGTAKIETTATEKIVTVTPADNSKPHCYRYGLEADLEVKTGDMIKPGMRLIHRSGPRLQSQIAGKVSIQAGEDGGSVVRVVDERSGDTREYHYLKNEELLVKEGQSIKAGDPLIHDLSSFGNRFSWRVRCWALLQEMTMALNENHRWVNLSDGGHIENLATIELLRRRCKLIVIGDGEADPNLHFNGLAILMRTAFIDQGINIEKIQLDALRLDDEGRSATHFAIGKITYPDETEPGYLLYLKSSFTGDESEVIGEYRNRNPSFPHEPTSDQFFTEEQFEAYRALGQHIGEMAVEALANGHPEPRSVLAEFSGLTQCFENLWAREHAKNKPV